MFLLSHSFSLKTIEFPDSTVPFTQATRKLSVAGLLSKPHTSYLQVAANNLVVIFELTLV